MNKPKSRISSVTRQLVLGVLLSGAACAQAMAVYEYTGNLFTSASPPFTLADHVSAQLVLDNPLAPNFTGDVSLLPEFELTMAAGAFSISTLSGGILSIGTPANGIVATDGAGNISDWVLDIADLVGNRGFSQGLQGGGSIDAAINSSGDFLAFNTESPGSWALSAVPLPPAVMLLGAALAALMPLSRIGRRPAS